MKRVRFKLLVLFLCLILMFGSVPVWAVSGNTDYVTREQAVVALLNTIGTGALNETESDLNVFIDANEITPESVDELGIAVTNGILAGTAEKALKPKNNITRLEFAMLVSRAIRELPFINESQDFSDISGNAEQDVNKLVRAGLMFGYGNDKFGPDDFLTSEQLKAIINRIANLSEIKAQDDFYYAVNYDWLVNTKLPAGYPSLTTFDEVNLNNKKRLDSIVGELIENSEKYQKGTVEQKMSDFYSTIIDIENRNKEGIEPIRPYLERIDSVKTLQEFIDLVVEFENKEGFNPIFTFAPSADLKDSTRYMLYGKGLSTALPSHYYINENPQIMALYEGFIAQMFMFSGINQEEAMLYAQQIYNFEKVIAQNTMSNEDASKIENIYNPIDADELAEMFENIDIKKFINDLDYKGVETVIVLDPGLMRKTGELIAEENIEILKIFSKYNIIVSAAPYLSKELEDAVYAFNNTFLGVSTSLSDSDKAFYLLNSVMGSYLGKMYVEKYFSEDAKKDVENMVKEIIETYRNRIEKLDWMAEETKNAAVSKLNAITLKIGYPEKWNDQLEGIEIKNYEDGGSLFGNILSIQKAQNK
jgi:putative endopeptidase